MLLTGWASRDFTPEKPVLLMGQFRSRVSTHVNDPVTLTALAIEAGGDEGAKDQAIMISCDLVYALREHVDAVRQAIKERVPDFDGSKLLMNATHTHTGPTLEEGTYPEAGPEVATPTECMDIVIKHAADAAVEAWTNRKPGGISWAFGHAVVGHNRRAVFFDGSAKMYANTDDENFDCIEGYEDHSVDMLFTWDAGNNLTGMVVNVACPSQVTEGAMYVSADFWHETREEIRKRHGAHIFILPQCAAGGDQSPHFLLYKKQEAYMREREDVSERQKIGRHIADAVDEVLAGAKGDIRTEVPFKHVVEEIDLPARKITDEEYEQAKKAYANFDEKWQAIKDKGPEVTLPNTGTFVYRRRNKGVVDRYEAQKASPKQPMELHVLRIGDVAMATNQFELFLDFGLRMKARSKALQTFVVQLACGCGSYLPTHKAISGKHYGAGPADNLVGPEGGQVLVNRSLELIDQLWSC